MTKSIKTSQNSRFKIVFNGEENCWYIHDKQYGDLIQVSPSKIDAKNMCDNMNKGSGFGEFAVPKFIQKTS